MFKLKSTNIKLKRKIITIKREKLKEIDLNLYCSLVFFLLFFICIFFYFPRSVFVPYFGARFLFHLTFSISFCIDCNLRFASHLGVSACPFTHISSWVLMLRAFFFNFLCHIHMFRSLTFRLQASGELLYLF